METTPLMISPLSPELKQPQPICQHMLHTQQQRKPSKHSCILQQPGSATCSYMQQPRVQLEHIAEDNTMLRSQVATLQSQLQYSVNRLQDFVQPPSDPVSRYQNAMFRSIPQQNLHNNPSGIVTVQNTHGCPVILSRIGHQ